jgi:hypothetical protein
MDWSAPPLIDFDVISARPLFSETRRPYVAPVRAPEPVEVLPPPPVPEISGVLIAGRRAAFFEEGAVFEGDTTESGWRVVNVSPDQVELSWRDQQATVRVHPETCCLVE